MIVHPWDQVFSVIDLRSPVVITEYLASISEDEEVVEMSVGGVLGFGLAQDSRLSVDTLRGPTVAHVDCSLRI